ncbi:unnamed protein product, partial [Didymodactylos carnosus]
MYYEFRSRSQKTLSYSNTTTKVLIIGAGLSGLEAARLLRQNDIPTIVLEGRSRVGGRVWSIRAKNDYIFDMGAAWIHGINGSIPTGLWTNPLWDIVQEAKIPTRGTLQSDMTAFYPSGNDNIDSKDYLVWYEEYLTYMRDVTKNLNMQANLTLRYYANSFADQKNLTEEQRHIFFSYLHFGIESYEGAEIDVIAAKGFLDVTSIHYGEEHVFHETGYSSLIDYIAKGTNIHLNKIVEKIYYNKSDGLVEVTTMDDEVYKAEYVLITVPLGVLKSRRIQFVPSLPQWKLDVIDKLGFGTLDKAVLLWNEAWWNSTDYYFMRISSKPNEFGYWVNANKWNDKPALVCYFVGKEAYRLETTLTKDEVIEEIRKTLMKMFNRTVPVPIDSYMTYWKMDPFSNGSYSYVSVDQKYEYPTYLAQPIMNQLLFAGEATSVESYGYAHGAVLSARREVAKVDIRGTGASE